MQVVARIPRWLIARQEPLVAALLVVSLLAVSLGVPVVVEQRLDLSRPFPCMHHRCGCGSAEACWRGCCCMTLPQKLAWAKEHGVTPPAYALAQPQKQSAESKPAVCQSRCGQCDKSSSEVAREKVEASSEEFGLGLVLTEDFRRCQGLATLFLTLSHALPPRVETKVFLPHAAPTDWIAVTSQTGESIALSPATPPPRHSS